MKLSLSNKFLQWSYLENILRWLKIVFFTSHVPSFEDFFYGHRTTPDSKVI